MPLANRMIEGLQLQDAVFLRSLKKDREHFRLLRPNYLCFFLFPIANIKHLWSADLFLLCATIGFSEDFVSIQMELVKNRVGCSSGLSVSQCQISSRQKGIKNLPEKFTEYLQY